MRGFKVESLVPLLGEEAIANMGYAKDGLALLRALSGGKGPDFQGALLSTTQKYLAQENPLLGDILDLTARHSGVAGYTGTSAGLIPKVPAKASPVPSPSAPSVDAPSNPPTCPSNGCTAPLKLTTDSQSTGGASSTVTNSSTSSAIGAAAGGIADAVKAGVAAESPGSAMGGSGSGGASTETDTTTGTSIVLPSADIMTAFSDMLSTQSAAAAQFDECQGETAMKKIIETEHKNLEYETMTYNYLKEVAAAAETSLSEYEGSAVSQ